MKTYRKLKWRKISLIFLQMMIFNISVVFLWMHCPPSFQEGFEVMLVYVYFFVS